MCAFIGVDRLQINGMAHDMIFLRDAIAAMHIARGAGNIQRLADIIALSRSTPFRGQTAPHPSTGRPASWPDSQAQFPLHIGQFFLVNWFAASGLLN